jgi:hypothetical protein
VSNVAVRELVEKMSDAGLAAKSVVNYVQVVKLVVASVVDSEGEQVYPRKWNHDFIQLPIVDKEKQWRPTVTEADLGNILSGVTQTKCSLLFALLAGTGLRIGEALALDRTAGCSMFDGAFGGGRSRSRKLRTPYAWWTFQRHSRLCFEAASPASVDVSSLQRMANLYNSATYCECSIECSM